jgi:excinuclease UvrABC nuclease subunit
MARPKLPAAQTKAAHRNAQTQAAHTNAQTQAAQTQAAHTNAQAQAAHTNAQTQFRLVALPLVIKCVQAWHSQATFLYYFIWGGV